MQTRGLDPLIIIPVNKSYVLGVYQGSLSQYDLLLKYRQMQPDGTWTRIRTPKHIHWAVDILIKMHENEEETKRLVNYKAKFPIVKQEARIENEFQVL